MTERAPWWKAFLPKKKSGSKESHAIGPDFDPWAPRQDKPRDPAHPKADPADRPADRPALDSDERYDDSHMESVFNEKTCRRNMNVSRSGRFKEKRRVRKSLPIQDGGAKEEVR
ncbi:proline-rich protein 15 [Boleophthalmus pectinirostris]|uniref:proline-rich protein 15 n=1 Tax=Boleophthalmus pectinirostris TaxID=150288 RepID=UPI00242F111C|nr:proline-rich protein 15 [Boleophthalmus pectinirostris]XP_055013632.1 proline-rich protein 15 [Boleophthalmus pectinirostris]